jgi:hypothetical protein
MQIPEYDDDSAPDVRRADEAYDAQLEAQLVEDRQDARIRDGVHALLVLADTGTLWELGRAMAAAFAPSKGAR